MDDGVRTLGSETDAAIRRSGTASREGAANGADRMPNRPSDTIPCDHPEVLRQQGREELRGELFTDLDRLAFALEVESAEAVEDGDEDRAVRLEDQRLGVRLAQRLVSGVHAHEVQPRIARAARGYADRTG